MALTLADWKSRIGTDLQLILGSSTDELRTSIVVRALSRMIRKLDRPYISDTITVTTSTGPYSVPTTIRKLIDIRDSQTPPESVSYYYDTTANQVTFISAPTAGTLTAYGTPANPRTNLSDIIDNVEEDWEDILWAYIKAYAFEWGNNSEFTTLFMFADKMAMDERKNRNRMLDTIGVPLQNRDSLGQYIGTAGNPEGIPVQIDDQYESDL